MIRLRPALALLLFATQLASAETVPTAQARAIESAIHERFQTKITPANRTAELAKAESAMQAVIAANPEDAGPLTVYARFCWRFGDQAKTLPTVLQAVRLDAQNPETLKLLSECYLREGRTREALDVMRRAAALEPENASLQFDMGTLAMVLSHEVVAADRDGVIAFAIRGFRKAIELDSGNSLYVQSYGEALESLSAPDWRAAFAAWQRVRLLNPDTDFSNFHLAKVAIHMGRTQDADVILQQITAPFREELEKDLKEEVRLAKQEAAAVDGQPKVITKTQPKPAAAEAPPP